MTHPKLHLPPQMHAHIYHWWNPYPSVGRVAVTAVTASNFALLLPRRAVPCVRPKTVPTLFGGGGGEGGM